MSRGLAYRREPSLVISRCRDRLEREAVELRCRWDEHARFYEIASRGRDRLRLEVAELRRGLDDAAARFDRCNRERAQLEAGGSAVAWRLVTCQAELRRVRVELAISSAGSRPSPAALRIALLLVFW